MSDNCFVATVTRIDVAATVTFVNEDDAAHMVTGASYAWGMGSDESSQEELFKGDTFQQTFAESGVYPYFCILHPSMVGAVVVGDGLGDGATQISTNGNALASTAPQSDRGEVAAASLAAADDGGASSAMVLRVVTGGVVLLAGIVVLAKTLAARRAVGG